MKPGPPNSVKLERGGPEIDNVVARRELSVAP
jgi:hypothetical protein